MAQQPDSGASAPAVGISLSQFLSRTHSNGGPPEWSGHCPCHDDKHTSLHVTLTGDKVLVHCFVCPSEGFIDRLRGLNLWPITISPEQATLGATLTTASADKEIEHLTQTDEKPPVPSAPKDYQLIKVHEYRTRQGHLLGTMTRFEKIEAADFIGKRAKKFIPTFYFIRDDRAQWLYRAPILKPFYNLPSLNKDGPVILVEGEKTCDAAIPHFPNQPVLSPMGGLQGFIKSDFASLQGRDVVIWPDGDMAWKQNAEMWAVTLEEAVNSIKIVHLPNAITAAHPKWDLADPITDYLSWVRRLYSDARPYVQDTNPVFNCVMKAEDLRDFFVKVFIGQSVNYVHYTFGRALSQGQFDDHFRRFTKPRFGQLPSQYLIEGPNQKARVFDEYAYEPEQPRVYIDVERNRRSYNLWEPAKLEPREGDITPFTDHLKWLFNDEDALEFTRRLANVIQRPRRRPTSVFLMQGAQGLGKSLIFNNFYRLVGIKNYAVVEPDIILSGYTALFACKIMVLLNEFTDFSKREFLDHIKGFIADPTMTVKEKYVPHYTVSNHTHFFAVTNQDRPVYLTEGERRFYVAKCVPVAPRSTAYYKELADWFENNPDILLWYLKNYDMGDWSEKAVPTVTEAKKAIITQSYDRTLQELGDQIREGSFKYNVYKHQEFWSILKERGLMSNKTRESILSYLKITFQTQFFPGIQWLYPYKGRNHIKSVNFYVIQPSRYLANEIDVAAEYDKERISENRDDPNSELI